MSLTKQMLDDVFDNTAASYETLKQTMIERMTSALTAAETAESVRGIIDRVENDVRTGRHRTLEDNTLNGNDAKFITSSDRDKAERVKSFLVSLLNRDDASEIVDGFVAQVRSTLAQKVIETVEAERLHENLDNEGDKGYMRAIEDVTTALRDLFIREGIKVDSTST